MPEALLTDVARIMAEVAAAEVMPRWRNLAAGDIAEKTGPDDIVTIADRMAEAALTARLETLLPGSVVVGEEAVAADARVLQRLRGPGPIWVIDPIDGTQAFATGETEFTLMVALVEGGKPAAGWIVAPALDMLAFGGVGRGVWHGESIATVAALSRPAIPPALSGMTGLLGKRNITEARRAELQAKEQYFGALDGVVYAGVDYMRLIRGDAHFVLYSKTEPWDHLPGLAMLAAHGYIAAKHDGQPYLPGDNTGGLLVAPDPASFTAIQRVLLG